jgi:hypothetical protein
MEALKFYRLIVELKLLFAVDGKKKLVSTYDPQAYGPTPFSSREFPRFLSIRGARGLQAFDLALPS